MAIHENKPSSLFLSSTEARDKILKKESSEIANKTTENLDNNDAIEDKKAMEGHRERLRVKLLASGRSGFSEHELLELLLSFALPRKDTKKLAKRLINRFGSLRKVIDASAQELITEKGIKDRTATLLILIRELYLFLIEQRTIRKKISSHRDLLDYFKDFLKTEKKEFFGVVLLDTGNNILNEKIAEYQQGTVDQAPVYVREIAEAALRYKATRVIIVHNHPAGTPNPSQADIKVTKRIKESLNLLDIELLDHIIVAGDHPPYSFLENSLL